MIDVLFFVILDNGSADICGAIFVCMYVIRITDGVKIGVKIIYIRYEHMKRFL